MCFFTSGGTFFFFALERGKENFFLEPSSLLNLSWCRWTGRLLFFLWFVIRFFDISVNKGNANKGTCSLRLSILVFRRENSFVCNIIFPDRIDAFDDHCFRRPSLARLYGAFFLKSASVSWLHSPAASPLCLQIFMVASLFFWFLYCCPPLFFGVVLIFVAHRALFRLLLQTWTVLRLCEMVRGGLFFACVCLVGDLVCLIKFWLNFCWFVWFLFWFWNGLSFWYLMLL